MRGVQQGEDINIALLTKEAANKYSLKRAPKLVEIISAVPDDFRDALLPK